MDNRGTNCLSHASNRAFLILLGQAAQPGLLQFGVLVPDGGVGGSVSGLRWGKMGMEKGWHTLGEIKKKIRGSLALRSLPRRIFVPGTPLRGCQV